MKSLLALAAFDLAASCCLDITPTFVMTWSGVLLILFAARTLEGDR